jgi:hypothetical protein
MAAKENRSSYDEVWESLQKEIKRLPYMETQNVMLAHWELDNTYVSNEKTRYFCTKCKWRLYVKKNDKRGVAWARYCNSCGAKMKMDGGNEDEYPEAWRSEEVE